MVEPFLSCRGWSSSVIYTEDFYHKLKISGSESVPIK